MPTKKTAKKAAATPKRLIVTAEGLNMRETPALQARRDHQPHNAEQQS